MPQTIMFYRRSNKSDKTNGYMWAMSSADTGSTLYYWQNSRSADTLNYLLRHGQQKDGSVYEGAILSDGYGGYESWMKNLPDEQKPQWQVCWAHVRRKFVEAAGNSKAAQVFFCKIPVIETKHACELGQAAGFFG